MNNLCHIIFATYLLTLWIIPASRAEIPDAVIGGLDRIDVYPQEFQLADSRQRMQFVITGIRSDGTITELTREARYEVESSSRVKNPLSVDCWAGHGETG